MNSITRKIRDTGLLPEGAAILDITASGRYWRTALIEEVSVIRRKNGILAETIWTCSDEKDDYEVLLEITQSLYGIETIITFNGHSFDLPFLRRKYEAYGLPDPLTQKYFEDLFLKYRPLKRICALPSEKLADYYAFSETDARAFIAERTAGNPAATDALKTLAILSLRPYLDAFDGKAGCISSRMEDAHLYLTLALPVPCPHELSIHDTVYHARFSGSSLSIGMPVENGRIRIYHTDLQNYVYLPNEGYSIHKSVAQFVDRTRREKPTRETCFHYAAVSPALIQNEDWCRKLAASVLAYMRTR